MRRVGILGGTFDPIHYGHLAIADEVRTALNLDQVLFIPAAHQPLKHGLHAAEPADRLAMVELACQGNPGFAVSSIEIERSGPSFSYMTLEALAANQPDEFFFILGGDALAELPRWRNVARVLELVQIVMVNRPGFTPDLARLQAQLPALTARLIRVDGPRLDLSSTELRQRLAQRRPIRYLVPDAVLAYIQQHDLYGDEDDL